MTVRKGLWLPSTSYLPEDDRLGLSALMYPSGSTTSQFLAKSGVIPRGLVSSAGPLQVVASSGMTCNVSPGQMIYAGPSANQGAYPVTVDAAFPVTFGASTSQPRIDVVYVLVSDTNFSGGSNNTQILVQAGTPATSPLVPTIPAGAFSLANVTIRASTSSVLSTDIADTRVYTTTLGGPAMCTSGTRPANPFTSMQIFETDTNRLYIYNGSAWSRVSLDGPLGVVAWGTRATSSASTLSEVGVLELAATLIANRFYKVWTSTLVYSGNTAGNTAGGRLRYTTTGVAPTLSSPVLARGGLGLPSFVPGSSPIIAPYRATTNHTLIVWLTACLIGGTGNAHIDITSDSPSIDLVIEDIGPIVSNSGTPL